MTERRQLALSCFKPVGDGLRDRSDAVGDGQVARRDRRAAPRCGREVRVLEKAAAKRVVEPQVASQVRRHALELSESLHGEPVSVTYVAAGGPRMVMIP